MQKKNVFLHFMLAILYMAAVSSCGEERNVLVTGYGDIEIAFSANPQITDIANATPVEVETPDADAFSFEAAGVGNGILRTWKSYSAFEESLKKIPAGDYLFSAVCGDADLEGFVPFAFKGECRQTVAAESSTVVPLSCNVANTLVSVSHSDNVLSLLQDISFNVKSEEGGYTLFSKDEQRCASVRPSKIKAELTLADRSGRSVTLLPVEIPAAKAAEHYEIRTDVIDNDGVPQIEIIYDESTLETPVRIALNDELFTSLPPEVTPFGYSPEEGRLEILENSLPGMPVGCTVASANGLQHLYLTVVSETFADNPWNRETDLVDMDAAALEESWLSVSGNEKGSKDVSIDFSKLIAGLPANGDAPATHKIILQAQDCLGKMANAPFVLEVVALPVSIALDVPEAVPMTATTAKLNVRYNGENFEENVQMQRRLDDETGWEEVSASVLSVEDGIYTVQIPIPEGDRKISIRALCFGGRKMSNAVTLPRIVPDFTIRCRAENIWSSKADLIVESPDVEGILPYLSIFVKEGGEEWHPAIIERNIEERRITVSTLMPGTSYSILTVAGNEKTETIEITTEQAAQLPNGDFEDIHDAISIPVINCGGKYSNLASWVPIYNTTGIQTSEPENWTTVNAKTCSPYAKVANTWFKIPTAETIQKSYSGAYAVKIRNAAWDIDGVEPPRDTRMDREYYSSRVPDIANRAAGKLFLGRYSFRADGTETYEEGIPFSSRPTSVSGMYSYVQDRHDLEETGLVRIRVIHEENGKEEVIGEGTGKLAASTSYTSFKVPVVYSVRDKRATKLQLMVSSSCYASYSIVEESQKIKTTDYPEKGVSIGAELIIDNLQLLYE